MPRKESVKPMSQHKGEPLLEIRNVTRAFGGLMALDNVSFTVPRGTICGLIGPNGAGKTTLVNVISGLVPATRGSIVLDGQVISGLAAASDRGQGHRAYISKYSFVLGALRASERHGRTSPQTTWDLDRDIVASAAQQIRRTRFIPGCYGTASTFAHGASGAHPGQRPLLW